MRAAVLVGIVGLLACGDDTISGASDAGALDAADSAAPVLDGRPDTTTASDGAHGPDVGADLRTVTFAVTRHGAGAPPEGLPAAGAVVALERPDGTTREAHAGDDGRVTFDAVETREAPLAFTAYLEGHYPVSAVGIEYVERFGIGLGSLPPEDPVTLSGTASGMADVGHRLEVHPLHGAGSTHDGVGPSFAVMVRAGRPTVLIALERNPTSAPFSAAFEQEILGWTLSEEVTPAADTTVSLDFGDVSRRLPTHRVTGVRLPLPEIGDPLHDATAYVTVSDRSADGRELGPIGLATRIAPDDARTHIEIDVEHVDLPDLDHGRAITRYALVASPAYSVVLRPGLPETGDTGIVHLSIPAFVHPGAVSLAGGSSVEIDAAGAPSGAVAQIFVQRDGVTLWLIGRVLDGATAALRVPSLPSGVDPETVLGDGASLDAVPMVCDLSGELLLPLTCNRAAVGRAAEATSP